MGRVQRLLAGAIVTTLGVASVTVGIRTSAAPLALAFVGGGAVQAQPVVLLGQRVSPYSQPESIDAALAAKGYRIPPGASVYAARVTEEPGGLAYDDFEGGGGALATNFWPASSIKVLAAVGALEFVGSRGFTGAATVRFGSGAARSIRSIYQDAISISSNADYDLLVEIAGVDWLNNDFLTPARGFPETVIQRSYTVGGNLRSTPALTLTEGSRSVVIPARNGKANTDCPKGQCSDLLEMSESIRRVVLNDEISESERFKLAPADVKGLTASLLAAEGWFEPAVARVLGADARIFGKPGQVPGRDCLDVALIETGTGERLLLSATVPEREGGCPELQALATNVLRLLSAA